jgi:hypothetical protein
MAADVPWTMHYNDRQQIVMDKWSCKSGNSQVIWSMLFITDVLAGVIGKSDSNMFTIPLFE